MPNEDYTTSTEVDPNNKISVTASVLTFTNLARNESAYRYWDKGVNYFNGDFTHLVDSIISSAGYGGIVTNWAVANDIGDLVTIIGAGKSSLSVYKYRLLGGQVEHVLLETDNGSQYSISYIDIAAPVTRYLKVVRDEAVGSFGTVYLYIYTDIARTNLLATLSVALHTSKKDYRYIYAVQSYNSGDAINIVGRNENLDLQEIVAVAVIAAAPLRRFIFDKQNRIFKKDTQIRTFIKDTKSRLYKP